MRNHVVDLAERFTPGAMSSTSRTQNMLIRQFRFPLEYSHSDIIVTEYHDRCFERDYDHATRCFHRHLGSGPLSVSHWAREVASESHIMEFLKEFLKVDLNVGWTGYRILGCVNVSNGFPVWVFQLFAKHPESETKVYTGDNAPNIKNCGRLGVVKHPSRRQ